jgi:hypothetical protein
MALLIKILSTLFAIATRFGTWLLCWLSRLLRFLLNYMAALGSQSNTTHGLHDQLPRCYQHELLGRAKEGNVSSLCMSTLK